MPDPRDVAGEAPRYPFSFTLHAREGADGQAVVCPLLRGSSPTRGVAPKQHRATALIPFITLYAREGADGQAVVCPLLRGSSPTRWVAPKQHRAALTSFITLSAREGADGQAVVCPLLRGSSATRGVAPKQHRGGCACRLLPHTCGLPQMTGGSASALELSRPARASLCYGPSDRSAAQGRLFRRAPTQPVTRPCRLPASGPIDIYPGETLPH